MMEHIIIDQLSNYLDFSCFCSMGITKFCDFRICDPCYFIILNWKEHIFCQCFNFGKKINACSLDFLQKKVKIVMQISSKTGLLLVFGTILRFYYIRCPWNSWPKHFMIASLTQKSWYVRIPCISENKTMQ